MQRCGRFRPPSRSLSAAPGARPCAWPMSRSNCPGYTAGGARTPRLTPPSKTRAASSTRPRPKSTSASARSSRQERAGSIESRSVALRRHALALDRVGADLLGDDAAERRPLAFRDVLLRVPQIRPDQRLAAMEIDLFGGDQAAAPRHLAVDRQRLQQRRIGGDPGAAVDPQGLVDPGDEEDQPHSGGGEQIADRVDPVVAEPVRNQQRLVIEHLDETRRIALRRSVAAAGRVARSDYQKWRERDEGARMLLQPGQLLLDRALHRLAVDFADLGDVLYDIHSRLPRQSAPTMHHRSVRLQAEKTRYGRYHRARNATGRRRCRAVHDR